MTSKVKTLLKDVFNGSKTLAKAFEEASPEERKDIDAALKLVKSKTTKNTEVAKVSSNGQWSLQKAITPGAMKAPAPTLDYSKINAHPKVDESKAPSINYAEMNKPSNQKPTWKQNLKPGADGGPSDIWRKINNERNERSKAAERQGIKFEKDEGANIDKEPSASDKQKMIVKNEMLGYNQNEVAQSEKEPHKDDPRHEDKEKKKAKKIKDEAESLLDMHKEEKIVSQVKAQMDSDLYEERGKHNPPMESPKK